MQVVLPGESHGSVILVGPPEDQLGGFGCLGERRGCGAGRAGEGCLQGEPAGSLDRNRALGQAVLDRLERADRPVELAPVAHMPDGDVEGELHGSDHLGGQRDTGPCTDLGCRRLVDHAALRQPAHLADGPSQPGADSGDSAVRSHQAHASVADHDEGVGVGREAGRSRVALGHQCDRPLDIDVKGRQHQQPPTGGRRRESTRERLEHQGRVQPASAAGLRDV